MLINTTSQSFADLIKALPCFQSNVIANPINIVRIGEGHSSYCFDVLFNNHRFFVKYINQEDDINVEITATQYASKAHLAPHIIYSDKYWLVCEFIEGVSLSCDAIDISEKIKICINLMKQCHTLDSELPAVNIFKTITEFSNKPFYTSAQQKSLLNLVNNIEKKTKETTHNIQTVLCHGDLNFSNVLINTRPWLLDFECACSGEVEFDLAMFLAINELTTLQQELAIKYYDDENEISINRNKLNSYLQVAYVLNGLWYLNRSRSMNSLDFNKTEFETFELHGLKQLALFDEKFKTDTKLVELMR